MRQFLTYVSLCGVLLLSSILLGENLPLENEQLTAEQVVQIESDILVEDPMIRLDVSVPEMNIDWDHLWKNNPEDTLIKRLTIGVIRSRSLPKSQGGGIYWERCGEEVPKEELLYQATRWAAHFLVALEVVKDETGMSIPVWGAFATIANEGGFNECSLNFEARKWAAENKVVDAFKLTYDRDTVWSIITHPKFAKGKVTFTRKKTGKQVTVAMRNSFDGGVWQLRKSMRKLTREEFDDITSIVPGVYIGAKEMADRALSFSKRYSVKGPFPRPWMLWPGANPYTDSALKYDRKIGSVARWLGASREEMAQERVTISVNPKNKRKRVYKVENL